MNELDDHKLAMRLGLGKPSNDPQKDIERLHLYINLKLASSGQPTCPDADVVNFLDVAKDLLKAYREKNRLLSDTLYPADQRIQNFINNYLADLNLVNIPRLPSITFVLDRHGIARELSLPMGKDEFKSDIVSSYRVKQGVLHNPASDRRTTKGSFHIAEGGLPIPSDKKSVPKHVFANMLQHAMHPPKQLMSLPFTSQTDHPAHMFVSLLLRPTVCPAIPGIQPEKNMEIRFFAPGNLVSNLDFVESIFGNGGNPMLAEFDAGIDVDHWSGHSGCVILAPHLVELTKKELGLPHIDDATSLQKTDKMCWTHEDEKYNGGDAFKLTARNEEGVIVTILADNYYGYCKKEVKTQLSYATNLYGFAEEEHAGGALAFACRNHGEEYGIDSRTRDADYTFDNMIKLYADTMHIQPEGYAIDKHYPDVIYVPQTLQMDLRQQKITWVYEGKEQSIRLEPSKIYMQPNGYKIEMKKHPGAPSWRLIGTDPEGTFCHKPCTVSGGGKSEISKALTDAVLYSPQFVDDLDKDLNIVQAIYEKDYANRFREGVKHDDSDPTRKPLDPKRSLGSVIRLLTPCSDNTPEFNDWLESIPPRIRALAFLIKRFYEDSWEGNWRQYLSVSKADGAPAHELKLHGRTMIASYLRVGLEEDKKWRTFKLRLDFIPAEKVQMEDDISVSVVVPKACKLDNEHSVKLVKNCEYRLFQRPDDAIHPGFDKQTEQDMSDMGNFMANFEPLKGDNLKAVTEDTLSVCNFTDPMRNLLQAANQHGDQYVVSSAHPRIVDGAPSKNPRYLQTRPDLMQPIRKYIGDMSTRFQRKLSMDDEVCHPVDAVLTGRRNNPPEEGIRPLAVYNPIHYQELPELFMDFICSLTGKSPSTTGAGTEGALTKGPFNALRAIPDLNNTLVSFILTNYAAFSSSAGHIGPNRQVDHDVSLLIPEIWTRLNHTQRQPKDMIEKGYLSKIDDFEYEGKTILASRLGYRITSRFVQAYLGKIFDAPDAVFTEELLKPELQSLPIYVDGINNIIDAQVKVSSEIIADGSIEDACPPLKALIYIMAEGEYQGMKVTDDAFRDLFSKENLLSSAWYQERLEIKQSRDIALWNKHIACLTAFIARESHQDEVEKHDLKGRLQQAKETLAHVQSQAYRQSLLGTIGADPLKPATISSSKQKKAA